MAEMALAELAAKKRFWISECHGLLPASRLFTAIPANCSSNAGAATLVSIQTSAFLLVASEGNLGPTHWSESLESSHPLALAFFYAPTHAAFYSFGAALRDQLMTEPVPPSTAGPLLAWSEQRDKLESVLQLQITTWDTLGPGISVLAPVMTACFWESDLPNGTLPVLQAAFGVGCGIDTAAALIEASNMGFSEHWESYLLTANCLLPRKVIRRHGVFKQRIIARHNGDSSFRDYIILGVFSGS